MGQQNFTAKGGNVQISRFRKIVFQAAAEIFSNILFVQNHILGFYMLLQTLDWSRDRSRDWPRVRTG